MMALNEDILDAIRNGRFSLRKTAAPTHGAQENGGKFKREHEYGEDRVIVARILARRMQREYSDEDEDDEDESGAEIGAEKNFGSTDASDTESMNGSRKNGVREKSSAAVRQVSSI